MILETETDFGDGVWNILLIKEGSPYAQERLTR
jgi:hypothetical protein